MAAAGVPKLYRSVIEDVISGVKDVFLDEGVDEQALQELRQIWEKKLLESKAIDPPDHPLPTPAGRPQATATTLQPTAQGGRQPPPSKQAAHHQGALSTSADLATLTSPPQRMPAATAAFLSPQCFAQPLTIGPNGLVQPTMLQYHTTAQLRGTPNLLDQKLTITLPPGQPTVMSSPAAAAALALHPNVAASLLQGGVINVGDRPVVTTAAGSLQFHPVVTLAGGAAYTTTGAQAQVVTAAPPTQQAQAAPLVSGLVQLDGAGDTSDEEEEEDDFNEDEDDGGANEEGAGGPEDDNEDGPQEEVEPLNSDDDVSDEEATENFEIDNVVVCQYDKISRSRNRWKFHFKDGIMNLQGKDYVFQKAVGDAEW